jgi:NAD(P)-dependent dehydrogenase (short-subunit alcohol dehydrogenase family)
MWLYPDDDRLGMVGKVAIVSSANESVGLAVATKLCDVGVHVTATHDGTEPDMFRAETVLQGRSGSGTIAVTQQGGEALHRTVDAVWDRYGRLDFFIHVIPICPAGPNAATWAADMALAMEPLAVVGERLVEMRGRTGRVVAVLTQPLTGSKRLRFVTSVLSATIRDLATELAQRSVTVNAISATRLDLGPMNMHPEIVSELSQRSPSGRLTIPHDIANAVALLCTDEAGWITGQLLTVDGGLSLAG